MLDLAAAGYWLGLGALAFLALEIILSFSPVQRWKLRHIPGPPALPLLGHLPFILRKGSPAFFFECKAKYGPIFKVAFGKVWVVAVADPDALRQVGTKLLNHGSFGRGLMLGRYRDIDIASLVSARDGMWRTARAAWQPAFSQSSLAGYVPLMAQCVEQLTVRLDAAAADGRRVDVWRELGNMTLQVVGSTAYGINFHTMDLETLDQKHQQQQALPGEEKCAAATAQVYGRTLVRACVDLFETLSLLRGSKYGRVAVLFPELVLPIALLAHVLPDRAFRRLLESRKTLLNACTTLINGWRAAHSGKPQQQQQGSTLANGAANGHVANGAANGHANGEVAASGAGGPVASGSFLDLILTARDKSTGEKLTDDQIVSQAQTFILAGYETTANALAFAIHSIASNERVRQRVLREVDEFAEARGGRAPSEADLAALPYTEAVFNEALRMYPPAPGTNRETTQEPLQVGGHTIPPGTMVFMSIYGVHHDPSVWPRPSEFIPERFLQDDPLYAEVCARSPYGHVPFGVGNRMCIGYKFALQEAKVALARLLQRYDFSLEPGQIPLQVVTGITMAPKGGLWVTVQRRDGTRA